MGGGGELEVGGREVWGWRLAHSSVLLHKPTRIPLTTVLFQGWKVGGRGGRGGGRDDDGARWSDMLSFLLMRLTFLASSLGVLGAFGEHWS